MRYYKCLQGDAVVGLTESPAKLNIAGFAEIGPVEFAELVLRIGAPASLDPEPAPEPEPPPDNTVWDEMAAAIREGVNSIE